MNGAAVIAEILKREGTEFLSCYPRNPLIEGSAALDIRPILCRQERVGVGCVNHKRRVADHCMIGAIFLVDVGRIIAGMNDRLAGRELPLLRKDLALLFCVLSFRQWHSAFLAFVDAKRRK